MTQDIIVIAIITLTAGYIVFGFLKSLISKKSSSACGGCSGCDISKNSISCNSSSKKF